jgi:hypothetical protein
MERETRSSTEWNFYYRCYELENWNVTSQRKCSSWSNSCCAQSSRCHDWELESRIDAGSDSNNRLQFSYSRLKLITESEDLSQRNASEHPKPDHVQCSQPVSSTSHDTLTSTPNVSQVVRRFTITILYEFFAPLHEPHIKNLSSSEATFSANSKFPVQCLPAT